MPFDSEFTGQLSLLDVVQQTIDAVVDCITQEADRTIAQQKMSTARVTAVKDSGIAASRLVPISVQCPATGIRTGDDPDEH